MSTLTIFKGSTLKDGGGKFYGISMSPLYLVSFEPVGKSVAASPGTNLLDAAQRAGICLPSTCGGQGDCGECSVLILEGNLSNLTAAEKECFSPQALQGGQRLACCARIQGSVRVFIPDLPPTRKAVSATENRNILLETEF